MWSSAINQHLQGWWPCLSPNIPWRPAWFAFSLPLFSFGKLLSHISWTETLFIIGLSLPWIINILHFCGRNDWFLPGWVQSISIPIGSCLRSLGRCSWEKALPFLLHVKARCVEKRRKERQENQGLVTFEPLTAVCLKQALFLFCELVNLFASLSQRLLNWHSKKLTMNPL